MTIYKKVKSIQVKFTLKKKSGVLCFYFAMCLGFMLADMCSTTVCIQACGGFCLLQCKLNSVSYMQYPLLLNNDDIYHAKFLQTEGFLSSTLMLFLLTSTEAVVHLLF